MLASVVPECPQSIARIFIIGSNGVHCLQRRMSYPAHTAPARQVDGLQGAPEGRRGLGIANGRVEWRPPAWPAADRRSMRVTAMAQAGRRRFSDDGLTSARRERQFDRPIVRAAFDRAINRSSIPDDVDQALKVDSCPE
jgi:hypothetical protein